MSIIKTTFHKTHPTTNAGITFGKGPGGAVVIQQVVPCGLAAAAGLYAGQHVTSINNCTPCSKREAATLVHNAKADVEIKVKTPPELITATFIKATSRAAAGVSFAETKDGRTFISQVKRGGLAHQAGLEPGYQVLSINNVYITTTIYHLAAKTLREAQGKVTFVVQPMAETIAHAAPEKPRSSSTAKSGSIVTWAGIKNGLTLLIGA